VVLAGAAFFSSPVYSSQEQEQEYEFDLSEIEKKPYTLGGFFELEPTLSVLDRDAAFYKLKFPEGEIGRVFPQYNFGVRLEGSFEKGIFSAFARAEGLLRYDDLGWDNEVKLLEGYVSLKPTLSFAVDVGKIVTRWGTGYARNPVAFVDRLKDPEDPQEPLEGFYVVKADLNKSFEGPLKNIAFTPVLLPVTKDVNRSFGEPDHLNFAAKLYLLLLDTDVDLVFFTGGSRTTRYGLDFARNLKSNLEIHGELAWITDFGEINLDGTDPPTEPSDVVSGLVGVRYLTENLITLIAEYYHNGTGLRQKELEAFLRLVEPAYEDFLAGDPSSLEKLNQRSREAFATPSPLKDYLYLRASQKDSFGIVYFTPGLTSIVSLQDGSFQLIPEIQYSFMTNLVLRGRTVFLVGGRNTEFGEKRNDFRFELRLRYFF
jgi:hypothetical protein